MKKLLALAAIPVLALGVTGCAKRTIDPDKTHSVNVPGTDGSLKKFCDGSTLIYWTPNITAGESDDYEFIVYNGCTEDGQMLKRVDINPGTPKPSPSAADLQQGDDED